MNTTSLLEAVADLAKYQGRIAAYLVSVAYNRGNETTARDLRDMAETLFDLHHQLKVEASNLPPTAA